MSAARIIPTDLVRVQIEASDPAVSAWVAANAGSGKTYVLAQRVIRLMLDGVSPQKILCLTFTKAAAANMANQVFKTLSQWIALDDSALDRTIEAIEGKPPNAMRRILARRLFAQAIETPGGLKVQTIHAFCTRLLQQFPFEANVAARFSVLEERAQQELLSRLRLQVLLEAAGSPDSSLGRALANVMDDAADQTFITVIDEVIGKRDAVLGWIDRAGNLSQAMAELSATLGVARDDTIDQIHAEILSSPHIPQSQWASITAIFAGGSANDQRQGQQLSQAMAATGRDKTEAYLLIFLTKEKFEPRKSIATKTIITKHPTLAGQLTAEQDRLKALIERRRAVAIRDRTAALLVVADSILRHYRTEKDKRGLLDYDDLIDKASALMNNVEAAWVHYKLDHGIDHVLIDEAQDTSPRQWTIVKNLVAEFTAGEGAREAARRSIFAVGDEKQSIFSFQGAVPDEFAAMRHYFDRAHHHAGLEFRYRKFHHSFRSGTNVLGAVDLVFKDPTIYRSVTTDEGGIPPHSALPDAAPGLVEIWPLIEAEPRQEILAWDAPFDVVSRTTPQVQLANRIAATIGVWLKQGLNPRDILILVRQRGPLFESIIRAIKNKNIPVAGADRLVLTEHIAVMDLMVLADALLLPDDDLALATALKSPLFGLDEDRLFKLAYGRPASLRDALRKRRTDDPLFTKLDAELDRLAIIARRETPFAFFAHLLGPGGGRKKILARLGTEAADALDEFLNLALDYEARETASLQGFLAWLRGAKTEIKRDMDIVRNEVRVMTVHGAKGLEARNVILADTTTKPTGPRDPRVFTLSHDRFIWAGAKADDIELSAAARGRSQDDAQNEYRRLLYVAMTRAADRLVVCGTQGRNAIPEMCWYNLIFNALSPDAKEEPADAGDAQVWRWRKPGHEHREAPTAHAHNATASPVTMPGWLTREAAAEPDGVKILTPSTAAELMTQTLHRDQSGEQQRRALARGRLVHRLLQALPDIPVDRRQAAARRHLAHAASQWTAAESETTLRQVFAVLDHPDFSALFAEGSRAEVPIVGRLYREGKPLLVVSGQVDRLAVTQNTVILSDYKTNRPAPHRLEDVPPAYVTQLALYRAVLARLYPDHTIRAALVWTDRPELMAVPAVLLDQAVAALV